MRIHRYSWALAAALLASCGDYGAPDEVLYGEAVYTQPTPGADFPALDTYYLNPTYREVDGEEITDIPLANVPAVLNAIVDNLEDVYGYVPGGDPLSLTPADVLVNLTVLKGNVDVYYPGYWCDYYYYYSCWYGGYYYGGSYDVGTVILEMGDLSAPGPVLPVLWTGLVYGVATAGITDQQRVAGGINRAFAQSPYLNTGP